MNFVSNRDIIIRSLCGQSIAFVKGVPISVPKQMHAEVMEKGIFPVEEDGTPVSPAENTVTAEPPKVLVAPENGDEYDEKILNALQAIVKRNDSKSFTGGNRPNAQAVSLALGYKVDQKAVNAVWEKNRTEMLNGKAA